MKRLFCGAAVAAALLISAPPSSAQVVNMTATLSPGEETPAPGLLAGSVGTAQAKWPATDALNCSQAGESSSSGPAGVRGSRRHPTGRERKYARYGLRSGIAPPPTKLQRDRSAA